MPNNTKQHLITPDMLPYKSPITFAVHLSVCTPFIFNIAIPNPTSYQTLYKRSDETHQSCQGNQEETLETEKLKNLRMARR